MTYNHLFNDRQPITSSLRLCDQNSGLGNWHALTTVAVFWGSHNHYLQPSHGASDKQWQMAIGESKFINKPCDLPDNRG